MTQVREVQNATEAESEGPQGQLYGFTLGYTDVLPQMVKIPLAILLVNHHTVTLASQLPRGADCIERNSDADVLLASLFSLCWVTGWTRSMETLHWFELAGCRWLLSLHYPGRARAPRQLFTSLSLAYCHAWAEQFAKSIVINDLCRRPPSSSTAAF